MPYTIPTATEFKAIYTEFAAVGDASINNALAKAALVIDTTWPEAAYPLAFGVYAAHVLRLGGFGSVAGGVAADSAGGAIKRRKAGDHEIEFATTIGGAAVGTSAWYALSAYGREFLMMQRRYFSGPRVF